MKYLVLGLFVGGALVAAESPIKRELCGHASKSAYLCTAKSQVTGNAYLCISTPPGKTTCDPATVGGDESRQEYVVYSVKDMQEVVLRRLVIRETAEGFFGSTGAGYEFSMKRVGPN